MQQAVFYIDLDIDDAFSQATVNARQGESGRKISVSLSQSGKPFSVAEGCHGVFAGTRPDGQSFFDDCTVVGESLVCTLSSRITAVPGAVKAELRLYGGEDLLITTPSFAIQVCESAFDEGEIAEGEDASTLTRLINQAQELIDTYGSAQSPEEIS